MFFAQYLTALHIMSACLLSTIATTGAVVVGLTWLRDKIERLLR